MALSISELFSSQLLQHSQQCISPSMQEIVNDGLRIEMLLELGFLPSRDEVAILKFSSGLAEWHHECLSTAMTLRESGNPVIDCYFNLLDKFLATYGISYSDYAYTVSRL